MVPIQRILVGIDAQNQQIGKTASLAVQQAQAIASLAGARVTLMHCLEEEAYEESSQAADSRRQQARALLEQIAEPLVSAGVNCEIEVCEGHAATEFLRRIQEKNINLLIVGKRTQLDSDGRPLGSVSLDVIRCAPCLVSVVRPDAKAIPEIVVAATDGGPMGERVLEAAAEIASIHSATLHVLHAVQIGMEIQMEGTEAERAFVAERRDAIREAARAAAEKADFGGRLEVHSGVATPDQAVAEAVERLKPDVVVLGTVSRTGISGILVGNTAEQLLSSLDCSLLVEKPADFIAPSPTE
ncbi:universal stress protein [Myxococcota bacterium]|nr:universal stress protein [Myxococcota bacterium]